MQTNYTANGGTTPLERAAAVARDGALARFLPKQPAWCRKVGGDVFFALLAGREISRVQQRQLEFAYRLALATRDGVEIGPAYPPPTHRAEKEARKALHAE